MSVPLMKDALLEQTLHLLIMAQRKEIDRLIEDGERAVWFGHASALIADLRARWPCLTCAAQGFLWQPVYVGQDSDPIWQTKTPCLACRTSGVDFAQLREVLP